MAKTDTSERWFEARVVRGLTGVPQPEYSHGLRCDLPPGRRTAEGTVAA